MKIVLWAIYESQWISFETKDHLVASAPISPCCRTLCLHMFLKQNRVSIENLTLHELTKDPASLLTAFNKAKQQF